MKYMWKFIHYIFFLFFFVFSKYLHHFQLCKIPFLLFFFFNKTNIFISFKKKRCFKSTKVKLEYWRSKINNKNKIPIADIILHYIHTQQKHTKNHRVHSIVGTKYYDVNKRTLCSKTMSKGRAGCEGDFPRNMWN